MAVSGRKLSEFPGSISRGSAEDFDESCVPCLSDGQHVKAHCFCVDCQEYLCKNCFHCHKKTRASKHHQLLDKASMDKHSGATKLHEVCTEKCSIHNNEIIKFFCPEHDNLGCHDCMTMKHRICGLNYIPEKCVGIGDSKEFMETVRKLELNIREAEAVIKTAAIRGKEVDDCYDKVMMDITKFRKEVDDHLDKLQNKIEAEANVRMSNAKQEIQAAIVSCQEYASNLRKVQTNLHNCKATKQNGQLFIEMKRATPKFHSEAVQHAQMLMKKTHLQNKFSRNNELENALLLNCFGKLMDHQEAKTTPLKTLVSASGMGTISNLVYKRDILLRAPTDRCKCDITACAVLSSDKLVMTDWKNAKVKVVNTEKGTILEKKISSNPRDLAVLPHCQIAVTIPNQEQILIINTSDQLSVNHIIGTKAKCYGVTYHQDRLYVTCQHPNSVLELDIKGNAKNKFALQDKVFSGPTSIILNQSENHLYISSTRNSAVVCMTLQGDVVAVYKNTYLVRPVGMVMLGDGSLLVCSSGSNTILNISADFKQSKTVVKCSVRTPQSICVSADKSEVYVGEENCYSDVLKVFSMQ